MNRMIIVCILVLGLAGSASAQTYDTLRIATYNLLNYPNESSTRNPEFRKSVRMINPDLIVVQEVTTSAGITDFLNNVLNYGQPNTYAAAPFSDGPDTDNGMYYRVSKLSFIGPQTVLSTALRDINGYRLRPVGISADSLDIQIYSAHLKASQGEEAARAAEATILRNHLNSLADGGFFIAAGDFNLYTSTEAAYQILIGSSADNSGRVYDPINTPGSWHDNATYAAIHTQSPRVRSFGGGSTGGMDDRFDFMLLSYNFPNTGGWDFIANSYTTFGNDGNHFDDSINALPNYAVPDSIANALHNAADHIPVYLDVRRQVSAPVAITVLTPNGSEMLNIGTPYNITWSSQGVTGNVSIEINRTYPSGAWESIVSGTANDGAYSWPVTGPVSTSARIRITSDNQPTVTDISDANFTISQPPVLTVIAPNGGEHWTIGQPGLIQWSGSGFTGNVRIEINRSYPSTSWTTLYGSAINDGQESWNVTGPSTQHARIRMYSVSVPTVGDTSNADFVIYESAPPVLAHDAQGDAVPGTVTFTAIVTDDFTGFSTKLFYRNVGNASFDSLTLTTTGNPDEFAAAPDLTVGRWEYFIRTTDSHLQIAATDTFQFIVAIPCGIEIAYDNGTAGVFQWSEQDTFIWAVRFTPPQVPFVLCQMEYAVAAFHPDSSHSQVRVRVYSADGANGMPGSLLKDIVCGSVGNVVGGLTAGPNWAIAYLYNDVTEPLELSTDFYVSVANRGEGFEAFGMDTTSASSGRSVVYNPCEVEWSEEAGNRLIRIHGWSGAPTNLVSYSVQDTIQLHWNSSGSPYYHIYRSADASFAAPELLGTVTGTSFADPTAVPAYQKIFYQVTSSSAP